MPKPPSGAAPSPRLRAWLAAPVVGSVLAVVSVVLPSVVAPPDPSPPPVSVDRRPLAPAGETVHAGWSAKADASANLVGLTWKGDAAAEFRVERRDRDGQWHEVGSVEHEDSGPDPGTAEYEHARAARTGNVSEPIWVGNDAREVRVRLTDGSARDVQLSRVETPKPDPHGVAGAATMPLDGVISRPQWGADESLRLRHCPEGPTIMDNVNLAVVHHTAGNNNYGPGDSAAIVRGLYAYATNVLHYCDTHYNFLIDKYGQIFEGRYGGISNPVLAAHATGINWNTVGIALIGDYSTVAPPAAMISSLEALIAAKLAWHGVDPTRTVTYASQTGTDKWPAGQVHVLPPIIGHRDPGATDCPGEQVYRLLPAIRQNVAWRIVNGPPDVVHPVAPEPGKPKLAVASAYGSVFTAGGTPAYASPTAWRGFPIARDVALRPGGGGYVLDGFGGIHPFGGAPPTTGGPYWYGWDIARDLVLRPGGGGYVLDGFGGIHPFGGAPAIAGAPWWNGFDIARKLALFDQGAYVLDGFGGIHGTAGAPPITGGPWWNGWDIAKDLVPSPSGPGGYLLDGFGGVYPLAGAPPLHDPWYWGADRARGLVVLPGGGGYALDVSGTLVPFGGAPTVAQSRATYRGAPSLSSPWSARAVGYTP